MRAAFCVQRQSSMAQEVKKIPAALMLAADSFVGTAPPAVQVSDRQPSPRSLPPQDLTTEEATLPYPRSPRLAQKTNQHAARSREALSRHLEELQLEKSRTEAHLQSLKKRSDGLSMSAEAMKQQIGERFEVMRQGLQQEERAAVDWVEQDHREASGRLNRVLRDWSQHLKQVQKNIASAKRALEQTGEAGTQEYTGDLSCQKKEDPVQEGIKMNEGRFQRLLKALRNISKDLQAQLQRKNFLLDATAVQIDRLASNSHIALGRDRRLMYFTSEPHTTPELPLQFNRVCCALGSVGMAKGKHYWEVDVGCCPAWAVGATYGCIERKGVDKGAKLGRNRHSWCLEMREGQLSAWHNDHHVACQVRGHKPLRKVGILLDYQRGRLDFYDGRTMKLLQEFSAVLTPVFDRVHHQFKEPVFPAFRFFKPKSGQVGPSHMEICDLRL